MPLKRNSYQREPSQRLGATLMTLLLPSPWSISILWLAVAPVGM
jgi:hypothetical protein